MSFVKDYLAETNELIAALDADAIEKCAQVLADTRDIGGRVFVLGVGGSAANASHCVNDLRKINGIESYAPTDNVAELTAWTNDAGWHTSFANWLDTSQLCEDDCLLIFSVNGGTGATSPNIVAALDLAVELDASVIGIIGQNGGRTATVADACVIIPPVADRPRHTTPQTEGIAMIVSHLLTSHPLLMR